MANKIILNKFSHWSMAVRHLYLNKPHRLEIIAMVAINNIVEVQSPEDIIREMKDMKEMVDGHSLLYT